MTASDATTVTVQQDVPFREVDGETLRLDVYEGEGTGGPKPVAVLVRGGAFTVGDKGEFARHAIDLASDGYLVVEPQYRLAPEHTFPAALVDVKAAVEWCRTEADRFGADPARVVAVGHSAGANLVTLAAATADDPAFEPEAFPGASCALDAVVGISGVYDFRAIGIEDPDHDLADYFGDDPETVPEAYDLASPVEQADAGMPPTLLLHGEDDDVVPPSQSELLADALGPLTEVRYEPMPGGHTLPFDGAFYDDVYARIAGFLDRHLGGGPGHIDAPAETPPDPLDDGRDAERRDGPTRRDR
ncbi:alpha/beta hydrolase [Haloarcula litorea]|uniref:alpha/beta hydrolase n=1 Tax=Haloarcula litorea TaxID=3032579 RepID=UPI0023E8E8F6|nr:alpha/beta hydrolase [Halomicroarcula sp. GDY20]